MKTIYDGIPWAKAQINANADGNLARAGKDESRADADGNQRFIKRAVGRVKASSFANNFALRQKFDEMLQLARRWKSRLQLHANCHVLLCMAMSLILTLSSLTLVGC